MEQLGMVEVRIKQHSINFYQKNEWCKSLISIASRATLLQNSYVNRWILKEYLIISALFSK